MILAGIVLSWLGYPMATPPPLRPPSKSEAMMTINGTVTSDHPFAFKSTLIRGRYWNGATSALCRFYHLEKYFVSKGDATCFSNATHLYQYNITSSSSSSPHSTTLNSIFCSRTEADLTNLILNLTSPMLA